jgi:hypothetical protein
MPYVVIGNDIDIANAKDIANRYGVYDLEFKQYNPDMAVTSDTIVVGGSGALGGVPDSELHGAVRLWGADRSDTGNAFINWLSTLSNPINNLPIVVSPVDNTPIVPTTTTTQTTSGGGTAAHASGGGSTVPVSSGTSAPAGTGNNIPAPGGGGSSTVVVAPSNGAGGIATKIGGMLGSVNTDNVIAAAGAIVFIMVTFGLFRRR